MIDVIVIYELFFGDEHDESLRLICDGDDVDDDGLCVVDQVYDVACEEIMKRRITEEENKRRIIVLLRLINVQDMRNVSYLIYALYVYVSVWHVCLVQ